MEYLNHLDHTIFEWIQTYCRTALLDPVFLAFRDKLFWIPLYVLLITWVFFKYRINAWMVFVIVFFTVLITDQLNSSVLKKTFRRDRPCNEAYFKDQYIPVLACSGGFSFPSSHATNHMGIGMIIILCCGSLMGLWKWGFLIWALLIGFSQVYVGVHFPFDVLVGWLEGAILAYLIYNLQKSISLFKNMNIHTNAQ